MEKVLKYIQSCNVVVDMVPNVNRFVINSRTTNMMSILVSNSKNGLKYDPNRKLPERDDSAPLDEDEDEDDYFKSIDGTIQECVPGYIMTY